MVPAESTKASSLLHVERGRAEQAVDE
jgi:hypothetical protein